MNRMSQFWAISLSKCTVKQVTSALVPALADSRYSAKLIWVGTGARAGHGFSIATLNYPLGLPGYLQAPPAVGVFHQIVLPRRAVGAW